MNQIKIIYIIIYIFFTILIKIIKVDGKAITLRNTDDSFYNLNNIISSNQNDKELIINLPDDYYDMSLQPFTIDIAIMTNIKIIGNNNGTIFDYKNKYSGVFNVRFTQNKGETVIIENIVFINLLEENKPRYGINFFYATAIDNTVKLVHAYHRNDIAAENFDCSAISFKNCNFINNKGLFFSYNSQIYFDNCYISKLEKYSEPTMNNSTIDSTFYAQSGYDYVNIKNSFFENINIKGTMPLIEGIVIQTMII
ncbi:hypothetical protein PIROE2DRAFT_4936 [Piromyces sp. E2]|nr:hypothetical protein PIROE2DRAFT_4936 [Piromyces sp. E2]|eukprot:OUM67533.1 hypothetical protein PIROE2DRAFT_4936 [Piromyces sp. E2]